MGLPGIRPVDVDIEFLATPEGITAGETSLQLRSHTSNSLVFEVSFKVDVVRTVEHTVEGHVKSVAGYRSVAGCELEIDRAEESHGTEFRRRLLIVGIAVKGVVAHFHVTYDFTWAQRRLLAIVINGEEAEAQAVGEPLGIGALHVDMDVAYMPLVKHCPGQVGSKLKL